MLKRVELDLQAWGLEEQCNLARQEEEEWEDEFEVMRGTWQGGKCSRQLRLARRVQSPSGSQKWKSLLGSMVQTLVPSV